MAIPHVARTRGKRTGAMGRGSSGKKWTCLPRRCFTTTLRVLTNSLHIYWALAMCKILCLVLGFTNMLPPSVILKPSTVLPLLLYVLPCLVVLGLLVNLGLLIMSRSAFLFTSVPLHCAQWLAYNSHSINVCWSDLFSMRKGIDRY